MSSKREPLSQVELVRLFEAVEPAVLIKFFKSLDKEELLKLVEPLESLEPKELEKVLRSLGVLELIHFVGLLNAPDEPPAPQEHTMRWRSSL